MRIPPGPPDRNLRERGHDALPASPDTGVNTLTMEGLAEALGGAAVVVDVSNSPSFEGPAALRFFETSTGTSWLQQQQQAWDTTSQCRSQAPIDC